MADDVTDHARDLVKIGHDDEAADEQVRNRHKRNDDLGDIRDTLHTTEDDESGDSSDNALSLIHI